MPTPCGSEFRAMVADGPECSCMCNAAVWKSTQAFTIRRFWICWVMPPISFIISFKVYFLCKCSLPGHNNYRGMFTGEARRGFFWEDNQRWTCVRNAHKVYLQRASTAGLECGSRVFRSLDTTQQTTKHTDTHTNGWSEQYSHKRLDNGMSTNFRTQFLLICTFL